MAFNSDGCGISVCDPEVARQLERELAAVTKERDEIAKRMAEDNLEFRRRDVEMLAQLTAAQAACAEKDEAIKLMFRVCNYSTDEIQFTRDSRVAKALHACLSNTAGQPILDRLAKAEAEVDRLRTMVALSSRDAEIADLKA